MIKAVELSDLAPLIVEKVNSGATVLLTASGTSMLPMLYDGRDVITLSKKPEKLKKYDLPLYVRKSTGQYVVHRIHKVCPDGTFVISGDNLTEMEYGVEYGDVLAVVSEFEHNGKTYSVNDLRYKLYCRIWCLHHFFRRTVYKPMKRRLKKIIYKNKN